MICKKCGARLEPGVRICPSCGHPAGGVSQGGEKIIGGDTGAASADPAGDAGREAYLQQLCKMEKENLRALKKLRKTVRILVILAAAAVICAAAALGLSLWNTGKTGQEAPAAVETESQTEKKQQPEVTMASEPTPTPTPSDKAEPSSGSMSPTYGGSRGSVPGDTDAQGTDPEEAYGTGSRTPEDSYGTDSYETGNYGTDSYGTDSRTGEGDYGYDGQ